MCRKIESREIDLEFQTMLLHYYKITPWHFDTFIRFGPFIRNILACNNRHNFLDIPVMKKRGQMGVYWNSIHLNPEPVIV
jgi:hypothetical protein